MNRFRFLLPVLLVGFLTTAFRRDGTTAEEAPDEHRFRKIDLTGDLRDLVGLDIAPNGDVYLIGHGGELYLYRPKTRETRRIGKLDVQSSEAMLQAIGLDPNFSQNRHLYLYYAPKSRKQVNLLSRFTLRGDTLDRSTEKPMLEVPDTWACCHSGGSMTFDRHGNLYLTTGDNTNPFGTNYSPSDDRAGREMFDAQRSAGNTNDLRGKILRIHPEPDGSYTIPKGNLFAEAADGLTRPEIYIMGCRNPFQVTVDRDTDLVYWSEIGPDASDDDPRGPRGYDELNQARQAGNHGWPFFIGPNEPYARVDFDRDSVLFRYDPQNPVNLSANNTGRRDLPPATPAFLWYPYDVSPEWPDLGAGGRTLVAGPIYYFDPANPSPIKFPAWFDRKLFLGEWMRNWLKVVSFDDQKKLKTIESFMPSTTFRKPISMKFGPDGALYLLEFGALWGGNRDSRLVRIEYIPGNRPPIARLETGTDAGAAPLPTRFSARNSLDYDKGDRISYRWTVNGKPVGANTAELDYTFQKPGNYRVKVAVVDQAGARSEAATSISVGNAPPKVSIQLEQKGLLYGPAVSYQVKVEDAEDGPVRPEDVQVRLTYLPTRKTLSFSEKGEVLSPYHRGATWIEENDCKGCHALKEKSVGPSFQAIAERYRPRKADPNVVERLGDKIIRGGSGEWGQVNMSAHPQLSAEVANEMVRYIFSLTDQKSEKPLPQQGQFDTEPNGAGTYILTARYTDKGSRTARPLTRQSTVVLRSPVLTAQDFDGNYEVQRRDIITDVHKAGYVMVRKIDLTDISAVAFQLATEVNGSRIEVRLDSPTGEIIGELDVPVTGQRDNWAEQVLLLRPTTGEHDLYFVFRNRLYVLNLVNIKQVQFRKETPK
ncbi:PQQ-dependent sugar dehydrogenase [Larkinella soli]|uniref:PQQ-dependent sugar dehydrogenase n=1 Tax=Larkinella soli TaxID=1770527 RepID=UPI0013E2B77A|nr:PQQ-dependent sugar dehydrogenase [Larkinella soli]